MNTILLFLVCFFFGTCVFFLGTIFTEEPLELKEAAVCGLTLATLDILLTWIFVLSPHQLLTLIVAFVFMHIMMRVLVEKYDRGVVESVFMILVADIPLCYLKVVLYAGG